MELQARGVRKSQFRNRFGTAFRSLMQMRSPVGPFQPPEPNSFRDHAYSIQHDESPNSVDRMFCEPAGPAGRHGGRYEFSSGPIVPNNLAWREEPVLESGGVATSEQNEEPGFFNNFYGEDEVVNRRCLREGNSQTAKPPDSMPSERGLPGVSRRRGGTVVENGTAAEAGNGEGGTSPRDNGQHAYERQRYDSGNYGANSETSAREDGDKMNVQGGDEDGGDEEDPLVVMDSEDEESDLSDTEADDEDPLDLILENAPGAGHGAILGADDEDANNITVARPLPNTQTKLTHTTFADPPAAGAIQLPSSDQDRIQTDDEDLWESTLHHARTSYGAKIATRGLSRLQHSGRRTCWRDMPLTHHNTLARAVAARLDPARDNFGDHGGMARMYAGCMTGHGREGRVWGVEPEERHEYRGYKMREKTRTFRRERREPNGRGGVRGRGRGGMAGLPPQGPPWR